MLFFSAIFAVSALKKMPTLKLNGNEVEFAEGTTVAVAILASGIDNFRSSVKGESRGPLCGMGICFECRVTINGEKHQTSCTRLAEEGMEIVTGE